MKQRMNLQQVDGEAYKAMLGFEKYLAATSIAAGTKELIKMRASQINGCAYCIDMHTKDARKLGETEQRIYALSAWRDTPFFSETEQAVLALTEAVTMISEHRVTEAVYQKALELLGEKELAAVIIAIITINAWNRIAITTGMTPQAN